MKSKFIIFLLFLLINYFESNSQILTFENLKKIGRDIGKNKDNYLKLLKKRGFKLNEDITKSNKELSKTYSFNLYNSIDISIDKYKGFYLIYNFNNLKQLNQFKRLLFQNNFYLQKEKYNNLGLVEIYLNYNLIDDRIFTIQYSNELKEKFSLTYSFTSFETNN